MRDSFGRMHSTEWENPHVFRASGSVWLEQSPDKGQIEGSNPSLPIKQVEWKKVIAFGAVGWRFESFSPDNREIAQLAEQRKNTFTYHTSAYFTRFS